MLNLFYYINTSLSETLFDYNTYEILRNNKPPMAAGDALSHGAVSSISMYDRISDYTLKFNSSYTGSFCRRLILYD